MFYQLKFLWHDFCHQELYSPLSMFGQQPPSMLKHCRTSLATQCTKNYTKSTRIPCFQYMFPRK